MAKLFEKYLVDVVGISETRAPTLAEAVDGLHIELCKLDQENLTKVNQVGLVDLMRDYARIETVKDVMPKYERTNR
jgi:hypothetical protein